MFPNQIICIAGKMGSGKDYISEQIMEAMIVSGKGVYIRKLAYADALKIQCILSCTAEENEELENVYDRFYEHKNQEDRIKMQEIGIDFRKYDENIWVKMIYKQIISDPMYKNKNIPAIFIISDFRFPNEVEYLYNKRRDNKLDAFVTTINIVRDDIDNGNKYDETTLNHISETSLDSFEFNYVFENNEYGYQDRLDNLLIELFADWLLIHDSLSNFTQSSKDLFSLEMSEMFDDMYDHDEYNETYDKFSEKLDEIYKDI